jgi:hypothetical protein
MWGVLLQNEACEVQDKNSDYGPISQEYSAHSDFQHWCQHWQAVQGKALPSFPCKKWMFSSLSYFFQVLIVARRSLWMWEASHNSKYRSISYWPADFTEIFYAVCTVWKDEDPCLGPLGYRDRLAGMIKSIKKSSELIGNRTRDLPACSSAGTNYFIVCSLWVYVFFEIQITSNIRT